MNYAVLLLENGLKEFIDTKSYIVAVSFPKPITDELIKIDFQIENLKNAIEFLKFNTRRTETQIFDEIGKNYGLNKTEVKLIIDEDFEFGIN